MSPADRAIEHVTPVAAVVSDAPMLKVAVVPVATVTAGMAPTLMPPAMQVAVSSRLLTVFEKVTVRGVLVPAVTTPVNASTVMVGSYTQRVTQHNTARAVVSFALSVCRRLSLLCLCVLCVTVMVNAAVVTL